MTEIKILDPGTGLSAGFREGGFAPPSDFEYRMDLDRFDLVQARDLVRGQPWEAELRACL